MGRRRQNAIWPLSLDILPIFWPFKNIARGKDVLGIKCHQTFRCVLRFISCLRQQHWLQSAESFVGSVGEMFLFLQIEPMWPWCTWLIFDSIQMSCVYFRRWQCCAPDICFPFFPPFVIGFLAIQMQTTSFCLHFSLVDFAHSTLPAVFCCRRG